MYIKSRSNTSIFAFFLMIMLSFLISCGKENHKKISQGIVTYQITYNVSKKKNPIVVLLPHQMNTYFKDDKSLTTIHGFFNTFKMSLLSRPDLDKKFVILRINDMYFLSESTINGPVLGDTICRNMYIKFLDSTFIYKNLKCKLAKIFCPAIDKDTFNLIYTNQIKIKNPNSLTIFKQIPGVIVKTKIVMLNIPMTIELVKLTDKPIDDKIFDLPKVHYKYLTVKEMEQYIKSFEK